MDTRLTTRLKPLSFGLIMLTAALLQARSVPDVDLLDAKGARVLRAGTYRVRLTHAKCTGPECAPPTVSETTPFEVLGDGTLSAWVHLPE